MDELSPELVVRLNDLKLDVVDLHQVVRAELGQSNSIVRKLGSLMNKLCELDAQIWR